MDTMKKLISVVLSLFLTTSATAETWIHIYGASRHEHSGYRETNTGIGIEHTVTPRWSGVVGGFQNSYNRQSYYVAGKYHVLQSSPVYVNITMGGVTGYYNYEVLPLVLPELCVTWVCGMYMPRVNHNTVNTLAFYLRIPLK
jgi:hypothetical protein